MRTPTIIAIALLATACGATKHALQPRVTILHANHAHDLLEQCSRPTPDGISAGWDIPPKLATQIETDLPKLANKIPGHNPHVFFRQYVGIVQSGKRLVYINAFAPNTLEKRDDSWKSKPTGACDGGDQFWGVVYDPAARTFSDLEFNGEF